MEGLVATFIRYIFTDATMNQRFGYAVLLIVLLAWLIVLLLPCVIDLVTACHKNCTAPSWQDVGRLFGTVAFMLTPLCAVFILELYMQYVFYVDDNSYFMLPMTAYARATWTQLWYMNLNLLSCPFQVPAPTWGNATEWFTLYRGQSLCILRDAFTTGAHNTGWCFYTLKTAS